MSESILRALMQLFALVAKVEGVSKDGRSIVKLFLKQQLSADLVQDYLNIFEEYLELHQKNSIEDGKARKKTSVNSVKVLRICTQINEELKQNQKIVVLIRLMEFLFSEEYEEQEFEFASTVASTFNIPNEEFLLAFNFLNLNNSPILDHANCLLISDQKANLSLAKNITDIHIKGYLKVLKLDSTHVYLAINLCEEAMYINGQIMARNRAYFLRHGSSIRNTKVNPIYFSDITSAFRKEEETQLINFNFF